MSGVNVVYEGNERTRGALVAPGGGGAASP